MTDSALDFCLAVNWIGRVSILLVLCTVNEQHMHIMYILTSMVGEPVGAFDGDLLGLDVGCDNDKRRQNILGEI